MLIDHGIFTPIPLIIHRWAAGQLRGNQVLAGGFSVAEPPCAGRTQCVDSVAVDMSHGSMRARARESSAGAGAGTAHAARRMPREPRLVVPSLMLEEVAERVLASARMLGCVASVPPAPHHRRRPPRAFCRPSAVARHVHSRSSSFRPSEQQQCSSGAGRRRNHACIRAREASAGLS